MCNKIILPSNYPLSHQIQPLDLNSALRDLYNSIKKANNFYVKVVLAPPTNSTPLIFTCSGSGAPHSCCIELSTSRLDTKQLLLWIRHTSLSKTNERDHWAESSPNKLARLLVLVLRYASLLSCCFDFYTRACFLRNFLHPSSLLSILCHSFPLLSINHLLGFSAWYYTFYLLPSNLHKYM